MADEVTKKDLQAAQAVLNKKIDDLEKRINAKLQAIVDTANKNFDALKKFEDDSSKFDASVKKALDELQQRGH